MEFIGYRGMSMLLGMLLSKTRLPSIMLHTFLPNDLVCHELELS